MKNNSSSGIDIVFEPIHCELVFSSLIVNGQLDIGLYRSNQNRILVGSDNDQRV
jgi:hypothetical protein